MDHLIELFPDRDLLCVQSIDATLSLFEQDNFAFTRFLPNSLLSGPLVYAPQSDIFITASSSWKLEAYKYQVLAVAASNAADRESSRVMQGKRVSVSSYIGCSGTEKI